MRAKYKGAPAPVRVRTPAGLDITRTLQPGDYVDVLKVDRVAHVRPRGWPEVAVVVPATTVQPIGLTEGPPPAVRIYRSDGRVRLETGDGLDYSGAQLTPEAARLVADTLKVEADAAEAEPEQPPGEAAEA